MSLITTPATRMLGITQPILLAGMGYTSGAELAAAVSNAGGLGVVGGLGYTPDALREILTDLKSKLRDPSLPFGVDLLIPQVGGKARKTNVDYTRGQLMELIDIIIEEGAKLFVSAVGIPPKAVVDKLHAAGVLYMIIDQTTQRPMGYGASMVNKKNQTAAEIVLEMTVEAYTILKGADRYISSVSKL
ncbi:hypothetical protein VF21_10241 [Pseudogymnoascus sp. 05NY08]|nr:hypothetical protein VF21_10241 [Pseudogymnoascus sp. 05NY08]